MEQEAFISNCKRNKKYLYLNFCNYMKILFDNIRNKCYNKYNTNYF